jgi:hypothetical protein
MIPEEKYSAAFAARTAELWADRLMPLMREAAEKTEKLKMKPSDEDRLIKQVCLFIVSYLAAAVRKKTGSSAGGLENPEPSAPQIPEFLLVRFVSVRAFRVLKDIFYQAEDAAQETDDNETGYAEWKLIEETVMSLEAEYLNRLEGGP